jgi:hypothetical protein
MLQNVVGQFPLEIGQITELSKLAARESDLSAGPVPESIELCTKLRVLVLNDCQIQGEFPVGVRALKSLSISPAG